MFETTLQDYTTTQQKATAVANAYAFAVANSLLKLPDLTAGIANATAAAKQMGANMYDVVTALAMLRNAGLSAEKAGTALNSMFTKLPELTSNFGIAVFDSTGKVRNLADILDDLRSAIGGTIDSFDEFEAIQDAFTYRGQRAVSILLANYESFKKLRNEIEFFNDVYAMAEKREEGFASQTKILLNNMQNMAIQIGTQLLPALKELIGIVNALINAFNSLPTPMQGAIGAFTGISGVALLLVGSLTVLIGTLKKLIVALRSIPALFNPVSLAISAVVAGFVALGYAITKRIDDNIKLKRSISELNVALVDAKNAFSLYNKAVFEGNITDQIKAIKTLASIFPTVVVNINELSQANRINSEYADILINKYNELYETLLKLSGIKLGAEQFETIEKQDTINNAFLFAQAIGEVADSLIKLSEQGSMKELPMAASIGKAFESVAIVQLIDKLRENYNNLIEITGQSTNTLVNHIINGAKDINDAFDGLINILPKELGENISELKKSFGDLVEASIDATTKGTQKTKEAVASAYNSFRKVFEDNINTLRRFSNAQQLVFETSEYLKSSGFSEFSADVLAANNDLIQFYQSMKSVDDLTGILYTKNQAIIEKYNILTSTIKKLTEVSNDDTITTEQRAEAISVLTKKLDELRDSYVRAMYEVKKEKISDTLKVDQEMFNDIVDNIKEKVMELPEELQSGVIKKVISNVQSYIDSLSEAMALGVISIEEYQEKMLAATNELTKLQSIEKTLTVETDNLNESIKSISSETENATKSIDDFSKSMSDLIENFTQISISNKTNYKLMDLLGIDELDALKTEYNSLKSYISSVYEEYLKYGKVSTDVSLTYVKSINRLKELNSQIKKLEELRKVREEIDRFKDSIAEAFISEEVNNKIIELKNSLGIYSNELEIITDKLNHYKSELDTLLESYAQILVLGKDINEYDKTRITDLNNIINTLEEERSKIMELNNAEKERENILKEGKDIIDQYNETVKKNTALIGITISKEEAQNNIINALIDTYERIIERKIKYGYISAEENKWLNENIETIKNYYQELNNAKDGLNKFSNTLNSAVLESLKSSAELVKPEFIDKIINELSKGEISEAFIDSLDISTKKNVLEQKINEIRNEIVRLLKEQPIGFEIDLKALLPELKTAIGNYNNVINQLGTQQLFSDITNSITEMNKLLENNVITIDEYLNNISNLYDESINKAVKLGVDVNTVNSEFENLGVNIEDIISRIQKLKIADFYSEAANKLEYINKLYSENVISEEEKASRISSLYSNVLETAISLGQTQYDVINNLEKLIIANESALNFSKASKELTNIKTSFEELSNNIQSSFKNVEYIDISKFNNNINSIKSSLISLQSFVEGIDVIGKEKILNNIEEINYSIDELILKVSDFNENILSILLDTNESAYESINDIITSIIDTNNRLNESIKNKSVETIAELINKLQEYYSKLSSMGVNINLKPLENLIDNSKLALTAALQQQISDILQKNTSLLNEQKVIEDNILNIDKLRNILLNDSDLILESVVSKTAQLAALESKRMEFIKRQSVLNIRESVLSGIESALNEAARSEFSLNSLKELFYERIKENILSAIITAFLESEKIKEIITSISDLIQKGVENGFSEELMDEIITRLNRVAESFTNTLAEGLEVVVGQIEKTLDEVKETSEDIKETAVRTSTNASTGEKYYYMSLPRTREEYIAQCRAGAKLPGCDLLTGTSYISLLQGPNTFRDYLDSIVGQYTYTVSSKFIDGIYNVVKKSYRTQIIDVMELLVNDISNIFSQALVAGASSYDVKQSLINSIKAALTNSLLASNDFKSKYIKELEKMVALLIEQTMVGIDHSSDELIENINNVVNEYISEYERISSELNRIFNNYIFKSLEYYQNIINSIRSSINTFINDIKNGVELNTALQSFYKNLRDSIYMSVLDGLIEAFLSSDIIKPYIKVLSELIAKALQDGIISKMEMSDIITAVNKLDNAIEPFIDIISELINAFGLVQSTGVENSSTINPFDLVKTLTPALETEPKLSTLQKVVNINVNVGENAITISGSAETIDTDEIVEEVTRRLSDMAESINKRVGVY